MPEKDDIEMVWSETKQLIIRPGSGQTWPAIARQTEGMDEPTYLRYNGRRVKEKTTKKKLLRAVE